MKKFPLVSILFLAFIHGLLYIFLIPPWQHYDEPSHFEHVRWVAVYNTIPEPDGLDLTFRRKLVQSMIANDFFGDVAAPDPKSLEANVPVYGLSYSQMDEPPVYYWIASLPVRFLQDRNPAVQLLGARGVSLGFFLITVVAIWGITRESTGPGSFLRAWTPLAAALVPGFVELMTAVNNDVGAVAAFSLFLWASLRFLNRSYSLLEFAGVMGSAALCMGMKSSAYAALPLSLVVLMLGWVQGKQQRWIWSGLGVAGVAGLLFCLTWEDAAYWHRATSQPIPTRVQIENAPLGDFVLQIDPLGSTPDWLRPLQQPIALQPEPGPVTLGMWMWVLGLGENSVQARTPILQTENLQVFETITIDAVPRFFAFEMQLPSDTHRLWLTLAPHLPHLEGVVYYDGLVLATGSFSTTSPPLFDDESGLAGTWGGTRFQNLVRNPSAERRWPAIRPEIDTALSKFLPDNARLSMLLYGGMDWKQTGWYFRATANHMVETFWGRFGWGHVPLVPPGWYTWLGVLSGAGLLGAGLGLIRRAGTWDRKLIMLLLTGGLIWGSAVLRGEIYIFVSDVFIPGARYAYPAIAPALLGLLAGWREWGRFFLRWLPGGSIDHRLIAHIILALIFLALDFSSIFSIAGYFYW